MASPIRVAGLTLRYLAPLLVVVAGVAVARVLIAQRKTPPKSEPAPRALPVEIVHTTAADHTWHVSAYGTVAALRSVTLRPTVGGPVRAVHPNLVAGGRVEQGDVLVEIDPRDYELAVAVARAALASAEADLEVERGNAAVAKRELELLSGDLELTEDQSRLALRQPIVAQREAAVETARTQLEQAELDLERTRITAPFDAVVTAESVEVGTNLQASSDVATLVATDTFVVEVSVPQARLAELDRSGPPARVHPGRDAGTALEGRIARLLPEVDGEGRMARLQIEVDDPLTSAPRTPLLLGSFAEVELPLQPVNDAVAIPRGALREGHQVWIVDGDERLAFVDVTVGLHGDDEVLVTSGLDGGERVVTSSIATPVPSMRVAPLGATAPAPSAAPVAAEVDAPAAAEETR